MPFESAARLDADRPVVNLGNVSKGFRGRIVRVGGPDAGDLERRLLEIGFVEGAPVEVVYEGPVGRDPIAIRVNETVVALRRREANAILAEPAR
ncbi:MAG: ferrous iron transport protein A [Proteobacteria bacterium]|nr:ferrous iron transport protein A [Pseudomonadota bacterium]